jgi:hypothetical protein
MQTYADVMTTHDVEIPDHLVAEAEIPVIDGKPQRQGDVIVLPMRDGQVSNLKPIPAEGIAVVRGEAGGNTHLLVGGGEWVANTTDPTIQGTLVVKDDPAFLVHPEHGAQGIGTGSYIVRRQREQADIVRLVAD